MTALNPLTLPLVGQQLIEASAGTGKTWTLSALYVRLVLGHGRDRPLLPPEILMMTFTEAATAELRDRVRARLEQALAVFQGRDAGDGFLQALKAEVVPERWPGAVRQLSLALQWMDEAAIFTIHGWCQRMLRQHAFDSGSLFSRTKLEDERALKLSCAQAYWRAWYYPLPLAAVDKVLAVASSPEALLNKLAEGWRLADRVPGDVPTEPDAPGTLLAQWLGWQENLRDLERKASDAWHAGGRESLEAVWDGLNHQTHKLGHVQALAVWAMGGVFPETKTAEKYTPDGFKVKRGGRKPEHPFFHLLAQVCQWRVQEPPISEGLLAHALWWIRGCYAQRKAAGAQFDFHDLLAALHDALHDAHKGPALASSIRAQYPVALVDEFQDTDRWQYESFRRIYAVQDQQDTQTAFLMVGDPKQAIYSFRGADIHTYLVARGHAGGRHTLTRNFRSTLPMVEVVNALFAPADEVLAGGAFGFRNEQNNPLPYVPVSAQGRQEQWQLRGQPQPALTLWGMQVGQSVAQTSFRQNLAQVCAAQVVQLLNAGGQDQAGFRYQDGEWVALRPRHVAILVRSGSEAKLVRDQLSRLGVRSVYLSEKESVFDTEQAGWLWRWLRAVAEPERVGLIRAVLAMPAFGVSLHRLDALRHDDDAWDAWVEKFRQWRDVWQRQGVLAMIYRLLHEQQLPARWLQQPDGERQLTNLLHLAELLQTAAQSLEGEQSLIHWLETRLHGEEQGDAKAHQLRLESDEDLVRVVTIHKSKGLEYPLVFLPFATSFSDKDKESADEQRLEEVRLLYVAMTRARHALWMGVAAVKGRSNEKQNSLHRTALGYLLGGGQPLAEGEWWQTLLERLQGQSLQVVTDPPVPLGLSYQPPSQQVEWQPALTPVGRRWPRWWKASYSAITRGKLALTPEQPADRHWLEESPAPAQEAKSSGTRLHQPWQDFPAGSQYGTLLHDLLELDARSGWQGMASGKVAKRFDKGVKQLGLDKEPCQCQLLREWLSALRSAPLSLVAEQPALCLSALSHTDCWPEMAFDMPVPRAQVKTLDALVRAELLPGAERSHLPDGWLGGMLSGFMDLVFVWQGRYYVLDYKSNRLPAYDAPALEQSLLKERYDIQAAIYLLALHRLLLARLPGYDPDTHLGGVVYWYVRGVGWPGQGLWWHRPAHDWLVQLDDWLRGEMDTGESPC